MNRNQIKVKLRQMKKKKIECRRLWSGFEKLGFIRCLFYREKQGGWFRIREIQLMGRPILIAAHILRGPSLNFGPLFIRIVLFGKRNRSDPKLKCTTESKKSSLSLFVIFIIISEKSLHGKHFLFNLIY